MCSLRVESPFLLLSGSGAHSPISEPNIMELVFLLQGPLAVEPTVVLDPSFLRESSTVVTSLLLVGYHAGGVNPD